MAKEAPGPLEIPKDFNGDFELFKEVASNLAQIVISRVNKDDFCDTMKEVAKSLDEHYLRMQETDLKIIFENLNDGIGDTIKHLREKAANYKYDEPAWRPTVGEYDVRPLEELALKKKKQELLHILKSEEEKCEALKEETVRRRKEVNELRQKVLGILDLAF